MIESYITEGLRIPDVYEVKLSFRSLLPDTFNDFLNQWYKSVEFINTVQGRLEAAWNCGKIQEAVGELIGKATACEGKDQKAVDNALADYLGTTVGPMVIKNFADGEIYVQVQESVRGDDVFIVQPLCKPVNEHLMELLIIIDAFKRASAKSAVINRTEMVFFICKLL